MNPLFLSVSLLFVSAPVDEQPVGNQPIPSIAPYDWPSSPGFGSGSFKRSAGGYFTDDLYRHLFVLRGTSLVLMYEPAVMESFSAVNSLTVNDFDVWPGGGLGPGHDALFVAAADGLHKVWVAGSPPQIQTSPLDVVSWPGALVVRSADFNQDGLVDVAGLNADGQTIHVRLNLGSNTWLDSSFLAAEPVKTLETMRYLPGQDPCITLATTDGVKFYEHTGQLITGYRGLDTTQDVIAVLRRPDSLTDQLAWCTIDAAGDFVLLVADDTGIELPVGLSPWIVAAATAEDVGGDGDPDLLLSLSSDHVVKILENQTILPGVPPTGSSFVQHPDAYTTLDTGMPGAPIVGNRALAIPYDLDLNGTVDVTYPTMTQEQVHFFMSPLGNPASSPSFGAQDFAVGDLTTILKPNGPCIGSTPCAIVEVRVTYPDLEHCVPVAPPTHFQVISWYTDDYTAHVDPQDAIVQSPTLANYESSTDTYIIEFESPVPGGPGLPNWSGADFLTFVYIRPLRFVGGQLRCGGPPLVGVFSEDLTALATVEIHPIWEEANRPWESVSLDGSGRVGGFFRPRRIPVPEDLIPQPGDL